MGLLGWSPAGQQIADDMGQFWYDETVGVPVDGGLLVAGQY